MNFCGSTDYIEVEVRGQGRSLQKRPRAHSSPTPPRHLIRELPPQRRTPPLPPRPLKQSQQVTYFYDKNQPYYGFTNFSPDAVEFQGKIYPTSEHLFQALKFLHHRPGLAEHIRTYSPRPRDAFNEAKRFQPEVRRDWNEASLIVMGEVLQLKFDQHPHLKRQLIETGRSILVEDSPTDSFWGNGADKRGRNELGKALMRLRADYRSNSRSSLR